MQRPASIVVFGILNIVFGAFALFGVFGVLALQSITDDSKNPVLKIMHENPAYATWVKCTIPLSFVSFALLVTSGIGLLRLAEWARKLSIAYGIYAILLDIAVGVTNFLFVFRPLFDQASRAQISGPNPAIIAAVSGIMGGVFGLIYPVLLIVFMTRPKIAAAFRPPAEPPILPAV